MKKLLLFCFVCFIPAVLSAARLTLRDGSVIYGQFVNGSEQRIVFQDQNGGRREFDINQVQSIDFGSNNSAPGGYYDTRDAGRTNSGRDLERRADNGQPIPPPAGQYNNAGQPGGVYGAQTTRPYDGPPNGGYDPAARQDQWRNGSRFAVLPAGTQISVRNDENIDSQNASEGRSYPGSIAQDVMDSNGQLVIPRGSQATLIVRRINEGGTLSNGSFVLDLDSVSVNGHRYLVDTSDVQAGDARGIGKNKRTGEMVGGGAVLGTLLGAIAGGGKGAAIGAVAGAAVGGGAQVLTKGRELRVPAETILNFRLDQPLEMREVH